MKWFLTMAALAAPSAVWAACEHAGSACGHGGGCGGLSAALMAGAAALGYWVLRQSEKDAGAVRWAGRVAGWVLLVVGLAGFVCGSFHHLKCRNGKKQCDHGQAGYGGGYGGAGYGHSEGALEIPPGHPPIPGLGEKPSTGKKRTP